MLQDQFPTKMLMRVAAIVFLFLIQLQRLLGKGLNFSLPCKCLDYADYLVDFQLFCRNIHNLGILSNEYLDFVKTRTNETALSSYQNYNNNIR